MTFRISIEAPAAAEIDSAYRWIAGRSPLNAVRWYHGLIESLRSLEQFPTRCGLAPENRHFKEQIRQLGYGTRMRRYRALFVIRGRTVHVLHFRHWACADGQIDDSVSAVAADPRVGVDCGRCLPVVVLIRKNRALVL